MREHRPLALVAALVGIGLYFLARISHGGAATAATRVVSKVPASVAAPAVRR